MVQVLVVDDEVLIREAICENIKWEELGFKLAGNCQNGKEAIAFLTRKKVDVILTDISMPFVDGIELSRYLFENFPEIHIIIFSGYDEFEYAKQAISYDVDEYMLKPITVMELSEVLIKIKNKIDFQLSEEQSLQNLRSNYNKNKLYLKSKAIYDLVLGNKKEVDCLKDLACFKITIKAERYRIALVKINLKKTEENNVVNIEKQSELLNFVVYNISDELVKDTGHVEVFSVDNRLVGLLFSLKKNINNDENINRICKKIIEKVEELFEMTLTVGIGISVYHKNELKKTYSSAKDALGFSYIIGDEHLIDIEKINEKQCYKFDYDEVMNDICRMIKLNEKEKICENIELFSEYMCQNFLPKAQIHLNFVCLVKEIGELIYSVGMKDLPIYEEMNIVMLEISNTINIEDAVKIIEKFVQKVMEQIYSQGKLGQNKYAMQAMDYIENNFGNSNLSLDYICTYLGISISRFSTLFKKEYKETFMTSLIRIRMDKAKELIEKTDMKNYEVADEIGFSDPHYFSLAFKKATGKSPKEYAKEMRK